jgi:hypothetical protein
MYESCVSYMNVDENIFAFQKWILTPVSNSELREITLKL